MISHPIRDKIVHVAQWGVAHRAAIYYAETRPVPDLDAPYKLPFTTDCSGFVTLCYKWAGAPDPNGHHYLGAMNTSAMAEHCRPIERSLLQPGDLVLWPDHVVVVVQLASHVWVVSHGGAGDPDETTVEIQSRYQHGATPRYVRCPGLG
jgi:cell wall-associated NlpC family hydrolase